MLTIRSANLQPSNPLALLKQEATTWATAGAGKPVDLRVFATSLLTIIGEIENIETAMNQMVQPPKPPTP